MNETSQTNTTSKPTPAPQEILTGYAHKLAGPAVSIISYGLITGFALSGLALMAVSFLAWMGFNERVFGCIGFMMGGLFVSMATALCLGKLAKAGDALYQTRRKEQTA